MDNPFKKFLFIICIILLFSLTLSSIHAGNSTNTFTNLSNQINGLPDNSALNLNDNYKFNNDSDSNLVDGISISKNLTLSNCEIDGSNQARGLYINSNCRVTLENFTFRNCFSKSNGGAIFLDQNSNLALKNCSFISNKVYNSNGGAIFAKSSTNTLITDSYFFNNTSIRESDLSWSEFKRGMGSALCVGIDSNLTLNNSKFINNIAHTSTILLISYNDVDYRISNLRINDCMFENNTSRNGGIIYLDELGRGEIQDCIFTNNHILDSGGVVILDAPVYALVSNCLFEFNSAVRGGSIAIPMFESHHALNVIVSKCNFTNNKASGNGDAIYANSAILTVSDCIFNGNSAGGYGGAICTNQGIIKITDSNFNGNNANYGGAISISNNENIIVSNSNFIKNIAGLMGGGVYSRVVNVLCTNTNFISNAAPKGSNVFGAFIAHITPICSYFNGVKLKIKLTSPWKDSLSKKVRIRFKGVNSYSTGWLYMPKNGVLSYNVPFNINTGKYALTVTVDDGVCFTNPFTLDVARAPCKVKVKRVTAHYKSGKVLKIHLKNSRTKRSVAGAKIKLKVYTNKNRHDYTLTTDNRGIAKFDTSKLKVGSHIIRITSNDNHIKLSKAKTSVKITKAIAKIKASKRVKKSHRINVMVKHKSTKKPIKKTHFKVKVYTGSGYYTINAKTGSDGVLKIATNKLSKGYHKINLLLKNRNYNIDNSFTVKIR